ncbi:unnamed protein product [Porites lobata]|uniref:Prefoldin subunit 6 n=1 Tax=Porites lobata TaxID=104759 RepID=A0ABN8QJ71_9CNID|nr:unnamed protein product [Porites lobata]
MADGGEKPSSVNSELLDSKISSTLYEIRELEVVNHELGCLHAKSKVYTRQGAGNLFFLSNRSHVVGQFRRKLDDVKKELKQLNKQKEEALKS